MGITRRHRWTVNGLGLAGLAAVTAMSVCGKSPESVMQRLGILSASGLPECRDESGRPVPGTELTGCHDRGPVVPVPTWAGRFALDITYPGGYHATAEGAVVFPTPVPTATPCIEATYGRVGPFGRCYDCAGATVAGTAVGPAGSACIAPATPTRTATPYVGPLSYCGRTMSPGGITFVECYICDPFTGTQVGPVVYCSSVPCGPVPCSLGATPVPSATRTAVPAAQTPRALRPIVVPFRPPLGKETR